MSNQLWIQSYFAKAIATGILLWGLGTGGGNLIKGVLEGYNTQVQVRECKINPDLYFLELERIRFIKDQLGFLGVRNKLSPDQIYGIIEKLSDLRYCEIEED